MAGIDIVKTYMRQNLGMYAFGMGMVAFGSIVGAQMPILLGRVTDNLREGRSGIDGLAVSAALIVLVGSIRVSAGWFGRVLVHIKGRELTYRLRRELFEKWGTLSSSYYQRQSVGDMISHALSDVEIVREFVSQGFNQGVSSGSMLLGAVTGMLLNADWRLTVASIGPMLLVPFLVQKLGPAIRSQAHKAQVALGAMAQTTEEAVSGVRAVKAFGQEEFFIERFTARVDAIAREKMLVARLSALFTSLVPLMVNVGFVVVLGYGGYLVATSSLSLGGLVAFTLYVALLRLPLEHVGNVITIVQRALPSLDRIDSLLRIVPDIVDRQDAVDLPLQGAIEVRKLTFSYPGTDRVVLHDISFTVQPGRTLGIIGTIGSGKSTLANLLLRLFDPPEGTVFAGGRDILCYRLSRLREGIAYVPQDGFLFSDTVLENIGFTDDHPDRNRARRGAEIAVIHDSIAAMPEAYDTEIGERGVRLSGGQKQRLAIARMIYKAAPVQIMDDALSAVDATTEQKILENLRTLFSESKSSPDADEGKISIIISHRLSAVQHADEILVLESGRIVERGNHEELLAFDGIYASQWFQQTGQFDERIDQAVHPEGSRHQERAHGDAFPAVGIDVLESGHLEELP